MLDFLEFWLNLCWIHILAIMVILIILMKLSMATTFDSQLSSANTSSSLVEASMSVMYVRQRFVVTSNF